LVAHAGFVRFWAADTVSLLGTYVTALALSVLAMKTLDSSGTELGILNAARWVPYLLFGLIAGVLVDRHRRRPILLGADYARAGLLALIPLLTAADLLTMPILIGIVAVFGALSLVYEAAHQSFLPQLVPTPLLTEANARMEQTNSVAQGAGPAIAGWLIQVVGAPMAILMDAVSYLLSGLVLRKLRVPEQVEAAKSRHLGREIREGLSWVYTHRTLAPLALTSHMWFLFHSMAMTVLALFVYRGLGYSDFLFGLTMAAVGVGGLAGSTLSARAVRILGAGTTMIVGRWFTPVAYALVPFATTGTAGMILVFTGQFLFGVSLGLPGPVEMGYRQAVTPDRLQGRMNATMRSLNRGMIVLGAPIGGALADSIGSRPALWIAVTGLVGQAIAISFSRVRHARVVS
jgi:predicted MFS family arabinose efflux permease